MSEQIVQLEQEIAVLRQVLSTAGLPVGVVANLQAEVATKEQQLAKLRAAASSQVGTQIDFGGGNQFGDVTAGDIAGGYIHKGSGPHVSGPIVSGRDTNIAETITINNSDSAPPVGIPPFPLSSALGLRLRLELIDSVHTPLRALIAGEEAALRVVVEEASVSSERLVLTLQVEADGIEWLDDTSRYLIFHSGTVSSLPRWSFIPRQIGAVTFAVVVLVAGTLVQRLTLNALIADAG